MKLTIEIAKAFAEYVRTEGCSCCQDVDGHKEAEKVLAKLLKCPKYHDGSGYDWGSFNTLEQTKNK